MDSEKEIFRMEANVHSSTLKGFVLKVGKQVNWRRDNASTKCFLETAMPRKLPHLLLINFFQLSSHLPLRWVNGHWQKEACIAMVDIAYMSNMFDHQDMTN